MKNKNITSTNQKILLLTLLFLPIISCSQWQKHSSNKYSECTKHRINLEKEFTLWKKPSTPFTLSANNPIPIDKKVILVLDNEAGFKFLSKPQKKFKTSSDPFAGLALLKVPEDGVYRVSAGSRFWIEVINTNSKNQSIKIKPNRFSMDLNCPTIPKSGEFTLNANQKYFLQISSGPTEEVTVMVSKKKTHSNHPSKSL